MREHTTQATRQAPSMLSNLFKAVAAGCTAVAYFARNNSYTNNPEKNLALIKAAAEGNLVSVKELVKEGWANVNAKDDKGNTPLSQAAQNGHLNVIKYLVLHGVDLDDKNKSLAIAVKNGHLNIVTHLVEQGNVNVNAKDYLGDTPLSHATKTGYLSVVQYLVLHRGVDLDAKKRVPNHCREKWAPRYR